MGGQADVVLIEGLQVDAIIGVYDWERAITQPLLIDIYLTTNISMAAQHDDVSHAINYKSVCDDVVQWCQQSQSKLLEHLAEHLTSQLLANYSCQQVTIKLVKPTAITNAQAVGVQITRCRPS